MRARLVTGTRRADDDTSTVQVRVLGRRDGVTARTLYQALWPASVKGQAVSFATEGGRLVSGFLFELPDVVTTLERSALGTALFGTELTVEDLVEDFWDWPHPVAGPTGLVGGQRCRIVELRPPARARSATAMVRACISRERALALLVEKVDAGGRTVRRFQVERAVRRDGRWVPTRLSIENRARGRTTVVEISRDDSDRDVAVDEFSPSWIKRMGAPEKRAP